MTSSVGHCRHDGEWPDPGGPWRGALAADRSGAMDLRGIPHHDRQADAQPGAARHGLANITIIALPPKCPELNPVENVWQFMRDNWLSNRIFKSYDDLVDHCCEAWNKLVDQPWRIMSIGLRQWAHEF